MSCSGSDPTSTRLQSFAACLLLSWAPSVDAGIDASAHAVDSHEGVNGADPSADCWTDGITRGQCCSEIYGSRGNPNCWDAGAFTFETCCGGVPFVARDCATFLADFGFSALRYQGDAVEKCAQLMDTAPARCNAANITVASCPACAALSPHLIRYIRCVRAEQAGPGNRGGLEGTPAFINGIHYPTVLRQRFVGRPFTVVASAFDSYVGNQMISDGHWNRHETRLLSSLLPPNGVAVDAGANIGGFTLPLARHVGNDGEVHAFEPFRVTFQMLTANCALNGLQSCYTYQRALGSRSATKRVRMPGLNAIGNPSKMYVAEHVASERHIHYDQARWENVEVVTLDSMSLSRLDLLKIDVESMELEVLHGAAQTLDRHRPAVYVEDSEADGHLHPTRLVRLLKERHSYECRDLAKDGILGMTSLLCTPEEHKFRLPTW